MRGNYPKFTGFQNSSKTKKSKTKSGFKGSEIIFFIIIFGGIAGIGAYAYLNPNIKFNLRNISDYYPNCTAAHADNVYNIRRWEKAYRPELDADNDGKACEPYLY